MPNDFHQRLFPEVSTIDRFREAYAAIPKLMQSSFGQKKKSKEIKNKGFHSVVAQQMLKGGKILDGVWIAPENLAQIVALANGVKEHRQQKEICRIQMLTADVTEDLAKYFEFGVISPELVKDCVIGNSRIDVVKQRVLREAVKKLDWKHHFTYSGESATIHYTVDVFGKTAPMACVVKQEEAQEIFEAVYAGDISVVHGLQEKYAKRSVKSIEKRLQALIDAMPEWVPEATIKEHLVRQIEAGNIPSKITKTDLRSLLVRHLSGVTFTGLSEAGVYTALKASEMPVTLAIQIGDKECSILSSLQINPMLDAILERDGSFVEIANAHINSYANKCRSDIQDVIARVLKSKMYTRTAGLIGEENATEVVLSALRYQMKRHHRHDSLDPKLTYNSMLRSIEFDGAGKIAQVTAERCRRAIPNRLAEFYPLARSLNRKITMISGPTNSGKTYKALEILKASKSGAYLGPLRLLALEVCEKLRDDGYPTSLVTGEFIDEVPGAKFMAATIEMLDFNHRLDTIIIDEAHMLGDRQRGAVWLQALCGSPAAHVIVLGSPESEAAVASLAEYLGEELQVERVERFTPYTINAKHTPLADIKPATAVIAFSRKDVLAIASELNDMGRTTAVVYGALSPAVRREQARKFRDGEAEILCASDSIALGLNLPASTVLFSTMDKYDGQSTKQVEPHLVWQIAGRAGRYGFHEEGRVGAIDAQTLSRLSKAMGVRPKPVSDVYSYGPTMPIVNTLSRHLDTGKLVPILSFFKNDLKLSDDNRFHPYVDEDQLAVALVLDGHTLSLDAKMRVLHAPVPIDHGVVDDNYDDFIGHMSGKNRQKTCLVRHYISMQAEHNTISLKAAEHAVKILTLYCWMHYRFPDTFPDLELALVEMDNLNEAITNMLAKPTSEKHCSSCGRKLPWNHSFGKCTSCFNLFRRQRRDSWEDDFDDY